MPIPAPVNQVVTFSYADWLGQFPEFTGLTTATQAQGLFNQATLLCDNTPSSPVQDPFTLTTLLYLATAHLAKLFNIVAGQQATPLVGRVASATQGSVSVSTVYMTPTSDLQAYWNQTNYGAMFWAATAQYRTGLYVPPAAPTPGTWTRW